MPHSPCSHPLLAPSVLDGLARHLAEDHLGADHSVLVRARADGAEVELAVRPLPAGVHPADALVGHTVPSRWAASGVVAPARARGLGEADGPGHAVAVAALAGRDGHLAHHLAGLAAALPTPGADEPPEGRLPDLLRRTLGLPTPPPEGPAAMWWRAYWLDAVVAAAAAAPRPAPPPEAPLVTVLPPDLVDALVADPALTTVAGWDRLHAVAARPSVAADGHDAALRRAVAPTVDPSMAAWMDVGCFARWLLTSLPPVDELLALAEALVPTATFAALRHVVGAPGLGDR